MTEARYISPEANGTETSEDLSLFLKATATIESGHPDVVAFANKHLGGAQNEVDKAVRLYYAVRDGIRYDPYTAVLTVDGLKASQTLKAARAWCVPKAILLAACCRAAGLPARLGYADVRNHLSTSRMRQNMQTEIFRWHGYTSICIEGNWVKATPAFNVELCRKFDLLPLEFDGRSDSLFHSFDAIGNRHMEYLRYRGEFADTPIAAIEATFQDLYRESWLAEGKAFGEEADFDRDVEAEMGGKS